MKVIRTASYDKKADLSSLDQDGDWDDSTMFEQQEDDWATLTQLVNDYNLWMRDVRVMSANASQGTDTFALFIDGQQIVQGDLLEIIARVKQIRKEEGLS